MGDQATNLRHVVRNSTLKLTYIWTSAIVWMGEVMNNANASKNQTLQYYENGRLTV